MKDPDPETTTEMDRRLEELQGNLSKVMEGIEAGDPSPDAWWNRPPQDPDLPQESLKSHFDQVIPQVFKKNASGRRS